MQHDDAEKDAELSKKVHNTLNGISDSKPTTPAPGGATTAAPAGGNQNEQMDAFFQGLMGMQGSYGAPMKPEDMSPPLQSILVQEKLLELIKDDPEVKQALIPHLPEGQQTDADLEDNLRSS